MNCRVPAALSDIDECEGVNHDCDDETSTCTNVVGSFSCTCNEGYEESLSQERTCVGMVYQFFALKLLFHNNIDINECFIGTHTCHYNAACENEIGSYSCFCSAGFIGDGVITCEGLKETKHLIK